jgi:hypothetical protein
MGSLAAAADATEQEEAGDLVLVDGAEGVDAVGAEELDRGCRSCGAAATRCRRAQR